MIRQDSNASSSPLISVILITPDSYQNLATTIRVLRAQTIRDRIEIVIVAPDSSTLGLKRDDLQVFGGYQVVLVGEIRSIGASYAAGVRRATAPIVVFGEDHCFPRLDWAKPISNRGRLLARKSATPIPALRSPAPIT